MDNVGSMQEQMGNVNKEMEILGHNKKEMLEVENAVTEMKSAFAGLIGRLDMAEGGILKEVRGDNILPIEQR